MKLLTIIAIALVFAVMDGVWLGIVRKDFYAKEIGRVQGTPMTVRPWSAVVAYILMVVGVLLIVNLLTSIPKSQSHQSQSAMSSLLYGGLLGLVIYGIYNATNYATLKRYSLTYCVTDTLWGIVLMSITTYVAVLAHSYQV